MKQTDEVDDLLTRAGARWRADQEAPPEPDLEYMLSGGRKHRRWVPALAAASVAVVAAGVLAVLPNPKTPTAEAPASPVASAPAGSTPNAGTPESFAQGNDNLLVKPGDKVQVNGKIVAVPGKTAVFCPPLAVPAIGYPPGKEPAPSCPDDFAVKLNGLDLDKVPGITTVKGVRVGAAAVTGIWRGGAIDVEEQSAEKPQSYPAQNELQCPVPPGGWTSKPSNISSTAVTKFLAAHAAQIDGPIFRYPNGTSRGAPVVILIGIAHGDATAFREAFEKVYQGNYCVVPVLLSRSDNERISNAIGDLMSKDKTLGIYGAGGSGIYGGGASVSLVAYTPEVKAAFTPLGLDLIRFWPQVRPVR
ncbi:hypothetical protein [Kribbella sp. VKM Ac-2566]|uniref:hypothetical protein n=1 Tax=Kribbella sp. VKM Ac-2566 TaxID=2512218 RepID=UPI0010634D15|nr:hypothetical protein [Kribbella sp. VKM Ac-2566]TDW91556.1 hypothetical protein EV647_5136 [Kribbella sp. VKM Ac-2566]